MVGAGIGGLTLAGAMAARGVPYVVYEQTRELAEVGAGVQLSPNAIRPLLRLGLGPALREHAVRIEGRHQVGGVAGGVVEVVQHGDEGAA
ncbi:salicylate 1-monooxygenase, partial [Streptomyces althioticus]